MPLIFLHTSTGCFTDEGRAAFVAALTDAACEAESLPDDPLARLRCLVVDRPAGPVYAGGVPVDELGRLVFVDLHVSDGVLDTVRRDRFCARVEQAATDAQPPDDRRLVTSVIFHEVPEGRWGREGHVMRLPEMAAAAGFEHLQHLVPKD